MIVKRINKVQLSELNNNSIFSSEFWLENFNSEKLFILGVFNKNNELIGSLILYKHKRIKFFHQFGSLFFTPNCDFYLKDETQNPSRKITFRKKVYQAILEYIKVNKIKNISIVFPSSEFDMQEFIWKKHDVSPKYTYELDLNKTEDELFQRMSTERRKNIKKAITNGVTARISNNKEEIKRLIERNFLKNNINFDKSVLEKILYFNSDEHCLSIVAYNKENFAIAISFCVFDNDKAYYLFGGYDDALNQEGAGTLAIWEAIKLMKKNQVKTFDLEGSMIKPIEKYFRGFGGKLTPYFEVRKNSRLLKLGLKLKTIIYK
jgi:hypothetical protein|tara:strand:- start:75 stop:1031 length:957 start_codon:yes stop_codon:yes gene_type:complete